MNESIQNIMTRRSVRIYKEDQISQENLDIILNAGLYAPAAGSRQSSIIVACQNKELNLELGKMNRQANKSKNASSRAFVSKEQPSIVDDTSIVSGFYDAPTVLTLFAPNNFLYGEADCCVMAENIMLAAHALDIGSCMVMRAQDTFANEFAQQVLKEWNIPPQYEAKVHITLGYRTGQKPKAKPRKDGRIIRVV